ncbi:S8 family serine peptidase [Arthrobacter tecti]
MTRPIFRYRASAACAAVVIAASTALGSGAAAAPTQQSTPVKFPAIEGELMSYVVNTTRATPGQTRVAARAVEKAGGVVVQQWPQIGVVIAQSTSADFREEVREQGNRLIESVGATRAVPVTEGTPDGIETPWNTAEKFQTQKEETFKKDDGTISLGVTVDPRESEQWNNSLIKSDQANQITDGSSDVLVGILDTGIDGEQADLKENIDVAASVNCTDAGRPETSATGWYPTSSDHGTHVAGTVAAARNGVGIVGVAPGVRIASVKVTNDSNLIYPEYAVCGFMWAGLNGMDVTNNSYYIDPLEFWCSDQPDQAAVRTAVERAVTWSTEQGVVHAAAAGNAAYDLSNKTTDSGDPFNPATRTINNECKDMPTELPGVVTVSSIDQASKLSPFSNRGLGVIDVAAPGSAILSTLPDNKYGKKSGTSMASPHVAGVLALMKSAHPEWTPEQMIEAVRNQSDDHVCEPPATPRGAGCVGTLDDNSYYGEGITDALDAVR